MIGALDGIKLAVVGLVCAILGWCAAILYDDFNRIPAATDAGELQERVKWTEEQNRARAKLDADRQAAQAKIADVERDYHARDQARQADMDELEAALAAERDNATLIPTPSPGSACACRPAISRGVRDRLQAIGRGSAALGSGSAGAQAPLR